MSDSDSLLPIVQPSTAKQLQTKATNRGNLRSGHSRFDWKNRLAVTARILLLVLIAVGIRARETANDADFETQHEVTIDQVQLLVPTAIEVGSLSAAGQQVKTADGESQGTAISTVPDANDVVGYRGASHSLLLLNDQSEVIKVALLRSKDTIEHVQLVQDSDQFWKQFIGWKMGSPKSLPEIDAVSGATLTSLAIAEGIAIRLGQQPSSLKFPNPITEEEIATAWPVLPDGASIISGPGYVIVADQQSAKVGTLLRSGAFSDSIAGYQGPTELLIQLDSDDHIQKVSKRSTWDNEPYASYLDDEPWFWDPLIGTQFEAAANASLDELGIEGVSGATMTSMAAAETLLAAAQEWNRRQQQLETIKERNQIHWTLNDIGSVIVVITGCLIAFTGLRKIKTVSVLWNILLVVYFGLCTGNLVSLVVIFGWSASGIAYQLAPGFTAVVAASVLLPGLTKRNIYCSHLCPHGAAQQLLRNRSRRRLRFSKSVMKALTWIPGVLLVLATVVAITKSTFNLAALEPFNAYIWYASGISSIVLAVVSLLWSTAEPMAWCRYGCATGRLLDYVRLSAASATPCLADAVVLGLAVASLAVH